MLAKSPYAYAARKVQSDNTETYHYIITKNVTGDIPNDIRTRL